MQGSRSHKDDNMHYSESNLGFSHTTSAFEYFLAFFNHTSFSDIDEDLFGRLHVICRLHLTVI